VEGYAFIDRMSWDNFNESKELIEQTEKYRERFGNYPESVHADRIYRSRDNLRYCQGKGIRLSGPKLGRPKKEVLREEKKIAQEDELVWNGIEGKFGQGKRRYSLNCIRAKLPETSGSVIAMTFPVMILEKLLKGVFLHFLRQLIICNLLGYHGHFAYNKVG
jgi:IS5 family transposase